MNGSEPTHRATLVVIADRHGAARAGAALALEEKGFAVVAECATAGAAIAEARARRPDVCLVDAGLGGDVVGALTALEPAPRVVLIAEGATVDDVLDALDAGAAGYLLKDVGPQALALSLADAARGRLALAPALAAEFVQLVRELRERGRGAGADLTRREREVLALLGTGLTTKQVAQRLRLSPTTVR